MRFQRFQAADGRLRWRFLSRNHRMVAVSPSGFTGADEAAAAIVLLQAHIMEAQLDFSSDRGGMWMWSLRWQGRPIAVSAHPYGRRREADEAAARFRDCAGSAPLDDWVPQRGEQRPRQGGAPAHQVPPPRSPAVPASPPRSTR